MKKNTIEEIVEITIKSGVNSGSVDFTPQDGQMIRCCIFTPEKGLVNDGFVNAGIKGSGGDYVSRLQDIRNYKKGNGEYEKSMKPFYQQGGKAMSFNIIATEPFKEDFIAQLILVYEDPNECNLY